MPRNETDAHWDVGQGAGPEADVHAWPRLSAADHGDLRRVRAIIQHLHHRERGEWGDPLDGCLSVLASIIDSTDPTVVRHQIGPTEPAPVTLEDLAGQLLAGQLWEARREVALARGTIDSGNEAFRVARAAWADERNHLQRELDVATAECGALRAEVERLKDMRDSLTTKTRELP